MALTVVLPQVSSWEHFPQKNDVESSCQFDTFL